MKAVIAGILVGVMGVAFYNTADADPLRDCADLHRTAGAAAVIGCLQPLAEAGDPEAELRLGEEYGIADGSTSDPEKSAVWLKRAAEHGKIDAQVMVGDLFRQGVGVSKDLTEAMKWYRVAAERGDQRAQYLMGLMYFKGWGTPRDVGQAISWEHKAADQNGPMTTVAEASIAGIYLKGDGVPQDYSEAAHWFRRAANHGSPSAYLSLAQLDEQGLGGPSNLVEAYVGYSIALSWLQNQRGTAQVIGTVARHRDDVASKLTAAQKAIADGVVRKHRGYIP